MKRLLIVGLLFALSSATHAGAGRSVPLCPDKSSSDCVTTNWGQTEPDVTDGAIAPRNNEPLLSSGAHGGIHMTVAVQSATTTRSPQPALKSFVSPEGLFTRETYALTSALKKARFYEDGSFATGKQAVERAAAELIRKAGTKYVLTLYIKTPRGISPDDSDLLDKRVRSINDVLEKPVGEYPGKPST